MNDIYTQSAKVEVPQVPDQNSSAWQATLELQEHFKPLFRPLPISALLAPCTLQALPSCAPLPPANFHHLLALTSSGVVCLVWFFSFLVRPYIGSSCLAKGLGTPQQQQEKEGSKEQEEPSGHRIHGVQVGKSSVAGSSHCVAGLGVVGSCIPWCSPGAATALHQAGIAACVFSSISHPKPLIPR